ncbi:hypothetical protein OE88DRAFT_1212817 [Heliocybe sulcata]|uniref:F-box domain-containing protein n=1 Tax=Heliocybe sulcata TaxID=5364 RepID=A0A5C3ML77_9AGAM|nr:hypothetical protein OE88DRAFT_1212817 [Heliocybe sulcata]
MKADHGKTDVGHLFPELLHAIFSFAFNTLGNDFATLPRAHAESSWLSLGDKISCSMVCKPWRDAAVPMLYDHVVLHYGSQLVSFLRTLNSGSDSFDYRRMVKSLNVDFNGHCTVLHQILEDILLLCPNLAALAYHPSQRTILSDESVPLKRLDPYLLTRLSLGGYIESTSDSLRSFQEVSRLQVRSSQRNHPVSLPHVTTLFLTLESSVTSIHALSTPSLTSLSINFTTPWNDDPCQVIREITATIGQSLQFLDIAWDWEGDNDGGTPGIFDLNIIEPCQVLRHLVVRGVSSFVGTHASIRFIDVWRDLISMHEWREAEQLDPEEFIENQLQVELLRPHLPNIARVRVFDSFLRDCIPDLPAILLPMGCKDTGRRVHVLDCVIWDTPAMVFEESRLDRKERGVPLPHIIDEFVSKAYKYLGVSIPDFSGVGLSDWEIEDTGSPELSEYESYDD